MSTWFETCRHLLRHAFFIVGVLVVGGVVVALTLMYSGLFNVAATVVDSSALSWGLVTVREASIRLHSRDVQLPKPGAVADRDNGFRIYRQECAMCHTPIGRTPRPMAVGFNPQPPGFGAGADLMTPAQVFWVTKNGIRFTGMPAWGPSRSDRELWDVVGFVMTLPKMSAADYDALDRRNPPSPPMEARGSDLEKGALQRPAASGPLQSTRPKSP
jgi:mono/diheme cytochrome c family protein